ncbi:hypothetical protein Tco_0773239 [Tanacetum coccineum]|uniref:Uncharacterized protein n=1 Tax=Tanacetum coccineum TaxID=301880 RepID=A0ABQ4ZP48_9ASTR
MSTPVFVDLESSTQADGAQSSRVPIPLPEDPYEDIRQAYLDGTDTESKPLKDLIDTETPESPLTVAPPALLPESTPPILVPILRRTACMAICVLPAMSSGLSASMAEVAAMSESVFYSLDSDSVSEDAEDEGPTVEDEDPAAGDEGLAAGVDGPSTDDESYGLDDESHGIDDESRGLGVESDGLGLEEEEEEAVLGGQQQAAPVVGTTISAPLGLGYGALRRRELALEEDYVYSTFEVGQGSGSAPESERPERVSAFRHPSLTTWIDPEDGMVYLPTTITYSDTTFTRVDELSPALFERYDKDIGELFTRSEAVRDEIFSQSRARLDLARLRLVEERRARLELAEVVDGMRRGQEPRGANRKVIDREWSQGVLERVVMIN